MSVNKTYGGNTPSDTPENDAMALAIKAALAKQQPAAEQQEVSAFKETSGELPQAVVDAKAEAAKRRRAEMFKAAKNFHTHTGEVSKDKTTPVLENVKEEFKPLEEGTPGLKVDGKDLMDKITVDPTVITTDDVSTKGEISVDTRVPNGVGFAATSAFGDTPLSDGVTERLGVELTVPDEDLKGIKDEHRPALQTVYADEAQTLQDVKAVKEGLEQQRLRLNELAKSIVASHVKLISARFGHSPDAYKDLARYWEDRLIKVLLLTVQPSNTDIQISELLNTGEPQPVELFKGVNDAWWKQINKSFGDQPQLVNKLYDKLSEHYPDLMKPEGYESESDDESTEFHCERLEYNPANEQSVTEIVELFRSNGFTVLNAQLGRAEFQSAANFTISLNKSPIPPKCDASPTLGIPKHWERKTNHLHEAVSELADRWIELWRTQFDITDELAEAMKVEWQERMMINVMKAHHNGEDENILNQIAPALETTLKQIPDGSLTMTQPKTRVESTDALKLDTTFGNFKGDNPVLTRRLNLMLSLVNYRDPEFKSKVGKSLAAFHDLGYDSVIPLTNNYFRGNLTTTVRHRGETLRAILEVLGYKLEDVKVFETDAEIVINF